VKSKCTRELHASCNHLQALSDVKVPAVKLLLLHPLHANKPVHAKSLNEWQLTQQAMSSDKKQRLRLAAPSTCGTLSICGQCHVLLVLQAALVTSSEHCAAECQEHRQHLLRRDQKCRNVCLAMYVQLLLAATAVHVYAFMHYSGFHVTKPYCITAASGTVDRNVRYSSLMQA
jgi:hypothetical protein